MNEFIVKQGVVVNELEDLIFHLFANHGISADETAPFEVVQYLWQRTVILQSAFVNQFYSCHPFFFPCQQTDDFDVWFWFLEERCIQHAELIIHVTIVREDKTVNFLGKTMSFL